MLVRPRQEADLDSCEAIARVVQERDGYPPHPPRELRHFVASPDALEGWVAELDGAVVGHVALHPTSSAPVMAFASEVTGQPPERLGVVARLFVDPSARRRGVAEALLSTATAGAVRRGLTPILDVATHFVPAVTLYEKHGWVRAGEVMVPFRGLELYEFVYIGPTTI